MEKEKLKKQYENATVEITLFNFSDIVTASVGADKPGLDNLDSWA